MADLTPARIAGEKLIDITAIMCFIVAIIYILKTILVVAVDIEYSYVVGFRVSLVVKIRLERLFDKHHTVFKICLFIVAMKK